MSSPYDYRIVDPEWENEWQVEDAAGIVAICADEDDAARIAASLNACLGVEDVAGLDVAALREENARLRGLLWQTYRALVSCEPTQRVEAANALAAEIDRIDAETEGVAR